MDSILHLICSFIIANSIYLLLYKTIKYNKFKAIRYSFYFTLLVGIGKETYDTIFKGLNLVDTTLDLFFDLLGVVIFLSIVILKIERE